MPASADSQLLAIVDAIRQLTPAERRRLQRHLRLSGLWASDELLTDRSRLQIAPALGAADPRPRRANARRQQPSPTQSAPTRREDADESVPYRSPVSGKVVVGSPNSAASADAQEMSPVPGQAPEQPIEIIFDGGSRGNPGQGYGSYAFRWPGSPQQVVRLRFGDRVTNNEAEYDTLIAALEATLKKLEDSRAAPDTARVDIWGDSLLVVNQVHGEWECKEPRLQVRRDHVRDLLRRFGSWHLTHHPRENSVRTLGH